VAGVIALLTDDAWVKMPPLPLEYQGRQAVADFFTALPVHAGDFSAIITRANGQPALAMYRRDPVTGIRHANGLLVLTLRGELISELTRFEAGVLAAFGLPRTLA
jgi:RNA polymerase sigma-70 factor (ECF subfamily)